MNSHTGFEPRVRRRRMGWIIRQPAERGALDALTGLTLWLMLLHGAVGSGLGYFIGSLAL